MNEAPQPLNFYEELLGQMQPKLLGYILSLVANMADAKDVLQESNQVIHSKLGELRRADRFAPWCYRIAYFQSLSFLKKRGRDKLRFGDDTLEKMGDLAEEVSEDSERKLARLERCLARLPDKSRLIVSDYYYENLSIKGIAEKRCMVANNVAQVLYRSRQALQECMTQLEENEHE